MHSSFPNQLFSNCTRSPVSLSTSIGYLYAQEEYNYVQSYWPVAYGRNLVSSVTNGTYFVVATCGPCYGPTVDLKTPQSCTPGVNCDSVYTNVLTIYRSVPLKVSAIAVNNCGCSPKVNFNWTFSYYNASSQKWSNYTETLRQIYISIYGNDSTFWTSFNYYNLRSITVPNHTMAYGLYKICLNITLIGIPGKHLKL